MTEVSVEQKRAYVRSRLKEDPLGCDLQVSLFRAAQDSYRYDTVLRPFPPMAMYNGATPEDRNYRALEKVTERLDGLKSMCDTTIDEQLMDVLYWLFTPKNFTVSSCKKDKYDLIKALTGQIVDTPAPTHIFELVPTASADERFQTKRGGRDTLYAYHGSRVENFHSILNYGLQSHMNKNALFGEGTYLSSELSVSMPYAPTGQSWNKSMIGDRMSIIAVCEIIDDDSVKCQVKDAENGAKRSRIANSMGGEVPEKYYVVQNNDMMRVKYVVLFAESSKSRRARPPSWAYRHRFALMMMVYGILLVIIGLYNSRTFNIYLKKWRR